MCIVGTGATFFRLTSRPFAYKMRGARGTRGYTIQLLSLRSWVMIASASAAVVIDCRLYFFRRGTQITRLCIRARRVLLGQQVGQRFCIYLPLMNP